MSLDRITRVLVVDDDPDVADFLETCFSTAGYEVRTAANGDAALREAATFAPHVVFLDIVIPEQDGWLVCSKLKVQPASPAIVLITGQHGGANKRFANFVQADAFLEKPFTGEEALELVQGLERNGAAVS